MVEKHEQHPEVSDSSTLSYKFERLREKLRQSIVSGEFSGKLPGERTLAKRFHVNAKTLSKALTDLAAEGLLDRSIGRGTYVKGSTPGATAAKRWLVICDPQQVNGEMTRLLRKAQPNLEVLTDTSSVRPSFLNHFSAVIDLAADTPDTFVRDLIVRNIPVVVVGNSSRTYSTHSVSFDKQLAVSMLGRELFLAGHRRVMAVELRDCTVVARTLRQTAARYAPNATIDACHSKDISILSDEGITAFVCQNVELAADVKEQLDKKGVEIPTRVSVAAVGATSDHQPVSGYFMRREDKVSAIVDLLNQQNTRPTPIWLAGKFVDRGTIGPVSLDSAELMESGNAGRRPNAALASTLR